MKLLISMTFLIVSLISFDAFSSESSSIKSRRGYRVRPVEIKFPESFIGSYASILYVSAKNSVITTDSSRPIVTDVLMRIPSQKIPKSAVISLTNFISPVVNGVLLNYLLIFIHDDEKKVLVDKTEYRGVFIKNPDGTCPNYHGEDALLLDECLGLPDESFEAKTGYTYEFKSRERTKKLKIMIEE